MKGYFIEIRNHGYFYRTDSPRKFRLNILDFARSICRHHNREKDFPTFEQNEKAVAQFTYDTIIVDLVKHTTPTVTYYTIQSKTMNLALPKLDFDKDIILFNLSPEELADLKS